MSIDLSELREGAMREECSCRGNSTCKDPKTRKCCHVRGSTQKSAVAEVLKAGEKFIDNRSQKSIQRPDYAGKSW